MKKLNLYQRYKNLSSFIKIFIFIGIFGILSLISLNFYLKNNLLTQLQNQKLRTIELNQIQEMKQILKYLPVNYYLGFFKIVDDHYETLDIINSNGSIKSLNPSLFISQRLSPETQEKLENIKYSIFFIDTKKLSVGQKEILEFIGKSNNFIEKLELVIIKNKDVAYIHSIAQVGKNNNDIDLTQILNYLAKNLKNNLN